MKVVNLVCSFQSKMCTMLHLLTEKIVDCLEIFNPILFLTVCFSLFITAIFRMLFQKVCVEKWTREDFMLFVDCH